MSTPPPPPPAASGRVESVEPVDPRGLRVRVAFGDGEAIEIALEVWLREGLAVGVQLDEADSARLHDADLRWRAREAALALLARRPHGRAELRRKLARKGFRGGALDDCLTALEAQGLVDDAAFACSFVRDRLRLRPRGRRRLSQELREKGLDGTTVDEAVEEVFGEQGAREETLAREAARAWLARQRPAEREALARPDGAPEHMKAARRLAGFLARRGFTGDVAREAAAAAAETARQKGEP